MTQDQRETIIDSLAAIVFCIGALAVIWLIMGAGM